MPYLCESGFSSYVSTKCRARYETATLFDKIEYSRTVGKQGTISLITLTLIAVNTLYNFNLHFLILKIVLQHHKNLVKTKANVGTPSY